MSREIINIGETVNDPNGDTLRASFEKTNLNFSELYQRLTLVESLNLPSRLPQGAEASGQPRRLVPTAGGTVVASHAILGGVDSAASMASTVLSTFAVCRLSPTRALIAYRAGSAIPSGERENTGSESYNVVVQIVKLAPDGTPTLGPRRLVAVAGANTVSSSVFVGGIARLDDHRAIVVASTSAPTHAAWLVDHDVATDTLAATKSTNAPVYRTGNNTHLHVTSDGMVALPEAGGLNLLSQTLSGSVVGIVSGLSSPATDHLGGDLFVSAGGSSVPGVDGVRLTLCLYRVIRGFPQLIDRLVTPHAFTSGASVYALSSDSAVVSWLQSSGSRAGGLVSVADGRISLASWTPNGQLGATPWGCLPLSPTRFLALVQTGNTGTAPTSGSYVWRALELVNGVLVEGGQFPVTYNVAGQTSGLQQLDAVVLEGDRVLLAGVAGNGAIGVKVVRFG